MNSLVFFCLRPKAKDLGIFIYLFLYHSILSIYKSIYQFIYQSIILYYLSKNVSNRLSINLSFYYINLQIYQNFYLSIYQSILYRRRPRSRYWSCFYWNSWCCWSMREALSWTRRGSSMHLWSPSRQPGQACHPSTGKSQFHQPSDSSGLTIAGRSPKIVITCRSRSESNLWLSV